MSFEKVRETRFGAFLAAGAAAVALAGCGSEEVRVLPIEVPQNALDLGSHGYQPTRSFVVSNLDVSRVYCGGVVLHKDSSSFLYPEEDEHEDFVKQVRPAGPDESQIDCVYDDWFAGYSEIEEEMVIKHFKSRAAS